MSYDERTVVPGSRSGALAFYRRLGLDVAPGSDGEPHVDLDLGGIRLMLDTRETILSFDPSRTPPSGGHRMGLAFACDSSADVDSSYAGLTEAGVEGHLAPWDAPWGLRYAVVHDPDGNAVDLFAPLT